MSQTHNSSGGVPRWDTREPWVTNWDLAEAPAILANVLLAREVLAEIDARTAELTLLAAGPTDEDVGQRARAALHDLARFRRHFVRVERDMLAELDYQKDQARWADPRR